MIEVYSKENCTYCNRAIAYLKSKNIPHVVYKLNEDFTREELLEKFPQARTFPQIQKSDGTYIGGYEELIAEEKL